MLVFVFVRNDIRELSMHVHVSLGNELSVGEKYRRSEKSAAFLVSHVPDYCSD